MDWAWRVLVPGRTEHDERGRHDLDAAKHDEDAGADGDRVCCGEKRRHQPYLKCELADASRAAGPDEVGNLWYVGCTGQPGTDKARDLCGRQHCRLTGQDAPTCPGPPIVITAARGAAASSWYAVAARPVDVLI